jgi:hypothetical protein
MRVDFAAVKVVMIGHLHLKFLIDCRTNRAFLYLPFHIEQPDSTAHHNAQHKINNYKSYRAYLHRTHRYFLYHSPKLGSQNGSGTTCQRRPSLPAEAHAG